MTRILITVTARWSISNAVSCQYRSCWPGCSRFRLILPQQVSLSLSLSIYPKALIARTTLIMLHVGMCHQETYATGQRGPGNSHSTVSCTILTHELMSLPLNQITMARGPSSIVIGCEREGHVETARLSKLHLSICEANLHLPPPDAPGPALHTCLLRHRNPSKSQEKMFTIGEPGQSTSSP